MPISEKAYELRQQRATLLDEQRVAVERCEKENRLPKPDEQEAIDARYAEMETIAKRISAMERLDATERIGGGGETESGRRSKPLPHEDPTNTRNAKHRFSILRAGRRLLDKMPLDGLEAEVSRELELRTQKTSQGFMMPYRTRTLTQAGIDAEKRALDSVSAGGSSVQTTLDKDWIELLRNAMKVMAAGAREILDLQGKFAIPRQSAAATAYWVAEAGAPTGSNQTLDQVLFTPHTIGAFTDINRRFFELTNIGADGGEEFVKMDLTAILARGVDLAALNGTGASNQPLGILQNTGITASRTVALGTNGAAPTWAASVEMHTIVARGNAADLGPTAFLMNADGVGTYATTAKIGSTFPVFLLEDGKVYAKPVFETQQLPNNLTKGSGTGLSPILYGVWNQLILAYWSGVDILIDPYTGSSSGTVRVVALQDMDIQVRHNEAFSVIVDMISNQTQ